MSKEDKPQGGWEPQPFLFECSQFNDVIGAYYPVTDAQIEHELRLSLALQKWFELFPEGDPVSAHVIILDLLRAEELEHGILMSYYTLMRWHLASMLSGISFLNQLSRNPHEIAHLQGTIWKSINDVLNAAAAISRLFDANIERKTPNAAKKHRLYRSALLRRVLGVKADVFVKKFRQARNRVEHAEEYIDEILHEPKQHGQRLLDLRCMTSKQRNEIPLQVARWYDPEIREIHIFDITISVAELGDLAQDMITIVDLIPLRGRYHSNWWIGVREPNH